MSTPLADAALSAPEQPPALAGAPPGGPPGRAPTRGAFQAELARTASAEGQQGSGAELRSSARTDAGPDASTTATSSAGEAAVVRGHRGTEQRRGERRGKASEAAHTGADTGKAAATTAEPQAAGAAAAPDADALTVFAVGAKPPAAPASSEAAAGAEPGEAPPAGSSTAPGRQATASDLAQSIAPLAQSIAPDGTPVDGPSAGDEAEPPATGVESPSPEDPAATGSAHTGASEQAPLLADSPPAGIAELPSQPPADGHPETLPVTGSPAPGPAPKASPPPALSPDSTTAAAPESTTAADRAGQAPAAAPTGTPPDAHHAVKATAGSTTSALKLAADAEIDASVPGAAADADGASPAGLAQGPVGGASAAASTSEPTPGYGVGLEQAIENMHVTIELAAREGLSQARIALEPEELGEIRIHLTQTSTGLIARVTAESPAAAQALAAGHAELRQSLSSMGLSLARLQIGHHGQSSTDAGRQDGARQRPDGELQSGEALTNGGSAPESPDDPQADLTGEMQGLQAPSPNTGALIDVLV